VRAFRAVVFDGKATARTALATLRHSDLPHSWKKDVAIVSRNRYGAIHAHSNLAEDDGHVATAGAMLSLVFGMGVLMGGSRMLEESGKPPFAAALTHDSSALLLIADQATLDDFADALARFGGRIIDSDTERA
jgi:hypothetical protein